MDARKLEGFEEEIKKVMSAMPPEWRLAGLDRDHQALALPLEVLRVLPDDYLRSLAPEIQAEIRRRLCNGEG